MDIDFDIGMRLEEKLLKFVATDSSDLDVLKRTIESLPIEFGSYDKDGIYSLKETGYDSLLVVPGSQQIFFYVDTIKETLQDMRELRNNIVPLRNDIKIETYKSEELKQVVEVNTGESPIIYFGFWKGIIVGNSETLEPGLNIKGCSKLGS